ncbi:heme lyase CcmF/NrfE family subunit [Sansalvadorimonas sp. 2012CJ34-2]|uniref:Heme lyase CcmF/NrfE family subunit n=1 Tax=Parendozoicomonas callyspongiae TaxID=2942213 RepID=A0ABT0PJT9_9GAMM|nr:heme lyase CcmF/NrfE family subunit [Sansalvadorimonas sp. 2012CJ34-2]MCL6271654.1 heme lyase CcmF/NrfE family subunit [Sansalvadorimonas sp. 2012CJ34-2]
MIPELGQLSLILSLCLALLLGIVPMIGSYTGHRNWQALAKPLAAGQFVFMSMAFLVMAQAFATDDFSVAYVANHSNSQLPLAFKLSAIWGGHEGSLLLWAYMLVGWTLAVAVFSGNLPRIMLARVLSIMGLVSTGFQLFMLLTSNPFTRLLPYPPADGGDLNPLLQDIGLIIHPPTLYMGYVGFSVAFAFAIAALLGGRLDAAWARWSRPWTIVAWIFLTMGIVIGSWWAYYELGWGGWWFWDPVENASFMPWLMGTALIHSLAVSEKRGIFKSWTVLLAISAFSLSLLGTFLVRSGVLTSVHAFASDPARGAFILAFLIVVVGSSLLIFAMRAPAVRSGSGFSLFSLETFLLVNNVLLVTTCAMVLLGTLYPLLIDALGMGKISVGPPFFNTSFVPLALLMALTLGAGVTARWKTGAGQYLLQQLKWVAIASVALGLLTTFIAHEGFQIRVAISMTLVFWVVLASGKSILNRCRHKSSLWVGLKAVPSAVWGMHTAHIGLAVAIVGVLMTSMYGVERDLRMEPGDSVELAGYTFRFDGVRPQQGPNYLSDYGTLLVTEEGRQVATLHPEKRMYNVQGSVMTEAGIDAGLTRDLYVALGENVGGDAWAVRIQVKSFVRWIWLGGILMSLGGCMAVLDRRYRMRVHARKTEMTDAVGAAARV